MILLLLTISQTGSILIVYIPLLVVLLRVVKKDHFKPLNLLHASLVIASIVEDVGRIILYPIHLPSAFRYCVCSALVNSLLMILLRSTFAMKVFALIVDLNLLLVFLLLPFCQ